MAVEKWVGLASLGLYIMFVAEILTILIYLVNPTHEIQPGGKILQYISISVAPALVLSGTAFLMSRRFGSRIIGSMIVSGGAILLVGMYYASTVLSSIANQYLV